MISPAAMETTSTTIVINTTSAVSPGSIVPLEYYKSDNLLSLNNYSLVIHYELEKRLIMAKQGCLDHPFGFNPSDVAPGRI